MIYIFEGMDNCLKDTLIQELRKNLSPETQVLKYSGPPKISDTQEYQKRHFKDMFDLLTLSVSKTSRNFILNRAHLGEYVYSPIYRSYEADWIFELEKEFLIASKFHSQLTLLLLLYDTDNNKLRQREDGKSFSKMKDESINEERKRFLTAYQKSHFANKLKFNLSDFVLEGKDPKKEIDTQRILDMIIKFK